MKNRRWLQFILFMAGLFVLHCARNKGNPVGAQFFQRDNMGTELRVEYQPVSRDTSFEAFVNTELSPYLYLGETDQMTSKILLQFSVLPDSGLVDSASVTLHTENLYGPPVGAFTATVHPILADWTSNEVTPATFTDDMIGGIITTLDISADDIDAAGDTLAYSFDLPIDLVQTWVDSTTEDENYGIAICPAPAGFMTVFYSSDNSDSEEFTPDLYLRYTTDTVRTRSYTPTADLFLAESDIEIGDDFLMVGNGAAHHAFIDLDVDTLPGDATINRALLKFRIDTTLSYPDHRSNFAVSAFPVVDATWIAPEVGLDSATVHSAGIFGDSLVFNLTSFVQDWAAGLRDNYGILLLGNSELYNLNQRMIYGMSADPVLRPRIEIFYTLPPSSKF